LVGCWVKNPNKRLSAWRSGLLYTAKKQQARQKRRALSEEGLAKQQGKTEGNCGMAPSSLDKMEVPRACGFISHVQVRNRQK